MIFINTKKLFKTLGTVLAIFAILFSCVSAVVVSYELLFKETAVYATTRYGSRGDEVKTLQKKLKELGYYNDSVDGIYGKNTQTAVKKFQKNVGISSDGIAGPTTLLYLGLGGTTSTNNTTYSNADVELLAKVISAEARGESYEGQVAVGAVILNRVRHPSFPNSISGVVYQQGAFSCVNDSNWYKPVSETSKRAAKDVLNGWDPSGGAIYYFNPDKTNDKFMHSRPVVKVIGNHKFCK